LLKFSNDIGLGNELFLRDLNYYFPQLEKGEGVSFQELLQFLDFTTAPIKQAESL
jgi:hypothetical protein